MKWLVIVVAVIAVIVAWQMDIFEPAASKAYRNHTKKTMERSGFSKDLVAQKKWSMEIEDCSVSGDRADIRAIVKTATIPPNAASFAFANIVTRTIEAEMEKRNSEDLSTYEDRKDSQLDR